MEPLIGSNERPVEISLDQPFAYDSDRGLLEITLLIRNSGDKEIVVPSIRVASTQLAALAGVEWTYYHVNGGLGAFVQLAFVPCLGLGVEELGPGSTTKRTVQLPVQQTPLSFGLILSMYGSYHEFLVDVGSNPYLDPPVYRNWAEVPIERIRGARFGPMTAPPARNWPPELQSQPIR